MDIKTLRKNKYTDINFLLKLIVVASIICFSTFLIFMTPYWLIGSGFLALMYVHMVELQHQCLHRTAFRSPICNTIIGFILGAPMLVSYSHYRFVHMQHHRHVGTKNDSEFFDYDENTNQRKSLIINLFAYKRYYRIAAIILSNVILGKPLAKVPDSRQNQVRAEYAFFLVALLSLSLLSFIFNSTLILALWFIPLVFAEPIHFLVELPEHYGCKRLNKNVLCNTRTIVGSKFSFWFTNGNNYHVEHHMHPSVPICYLPKVHEQLQSGIQSQEKHYWSFYSRVFFNRP